MTVPDFQSVMLPLLRALSDGQPRRSRDLISLVANEFRLSDTDLAQMLPSGTQRVIDNRVYWAASYLRHAGLVESPQRGIVRITDAGKKVLDKPPAQINIGFLNQFPGFQEFRSVSAGGSTGASPSSSLPPPLSDRTPEETLEGTWLALHDSLGQDLLAKIKTCSPSFFERLVVDLLLKMGYGGSFADAGKAVGRSGDGGIDGVIKEDKLGLDVVYVQAKRWEGQVGRPAVQGFAGSLEGARARKGVFITTSSFSPDARAYVDQIEKRIVLVDGAALVRLMMEHGVGVDTAKTFLVQKIDLDYFDEDSIVG